LGQFTGFVGGHGGLLSGAFWCWRLLLTNNP
jgi:hypothetical protein